MSRRTTVGLTGGIGSGKSTVAARLRDAGLTVVDADRLVEDLYLPGAAGTRAVVELFGEEVLAADGSVDRPRLAGLVFGDAEPRRRLEAAIHPLVRAAFAERAAAAPNGLAVVEAALLVDTGWYRELDFLVTVEAPEELRIARAVARGDEEASVLARIAAQASADERRAAADFVIENGGDLAALETQVDRLVDELRRR